MAAVLSAYLDTEFCYLIETAGLRNGIVIKMWFLHSTTAGINIASKVSLYFESPITEIHRLGPNMGRRQGRSMVKRFNCCRFWRKLAGLLAAVVVAMYSADLPLRAEAIQDERTDRFSRNILSTLTEENAQDLALLTQFYVDRDMMPIWVDDNAPTKRAHELVRVLEGSSYDGLNPQDYDTDAIRALMDLNSPQALAELDLRLSLGLMQFLSDLGSGRTEPSSLHPELFVYPSDIDKAKAIEAAAEADDVGVFVGGYRPRQVDYWRLKGVLANYRAMARVGGWPSIDPGPLLEGGERSPRIGQLRKLLRRLNDLQPADDRAANGDDPNVFDDALMDAVKRFQRRHGLDADGMVGPNTLKALNTPIEERIEQIVLNLERRRWMPDRQGSRYIFVNLADFHLQLIDQGEISFETPVVIGSLYNKTPVFSSEMTYLVINPYWNVPPSIATDEILPKLKIDSDYLARNGFDLFSDWGQRADIIDPQSVNWSDVEPDNFEYKLRQRPGPTNSLGRLKFMMPNDYNIYLHDTPDRADFNVNERSFSHGCVRVAEPEALANAILGEMSEWSSDMISTAVQTGQRSVVTLKKPLPVQLTYLTAWVDDGNMVHFRNDVYDRDQILADALTKNPRRRGTFTADISGEATSQPAQRPHRRPVTTTVENALKLEAAKR